ncbi:hypothetical protein VB735_28685 [Halotia wernerae UHCC 0503]|nr:hypothetical protein [Halotia wernerae UHCC 0503]
MINVSFSNGIKNPELSLTDEQKKIIIEYCCLASLNTLSEEQVQQIAYILEIAQLDPIINFWITEADHFIAHNLNIIDEEEHKNLQAILREHLVTDSGCYNPMIFRNGK